MISLAVSPEFSYEIVNSPLYCVIQNFWLLSKSKSQGEENDFIIADFTTSDRLGFLSDEKQVTSIIIRPRAALIMVGNKAMLGTDSGYGAMAKLIINRGLKNASIDATEKPHFTQYEPQTPQSMEDTDFE
jgi:hypothetical protein